MKIHWISGAKDRIDINHNGELTSICTEYNNISEPIWPFTTSRVLNLVKNRLGLSDVEMLTGSLTIKVYR